MNPMDLKPHPMHEVIYGKEKQSKDLMYHILEYGVLDPILVNLNHNILSGHRRWEIALKYRLEIPVMHIDFRNGRSEVWAIMHYNSGKYEFNTETALKLMDENEESAIKYCTIREKSRIQRMKEQEFLLEIEREEIREKNILNRVLENVDYNVKPSKYELLLWAKSVKRLDNYSCKICSETENLHAHHIFSKKQFPQAVLDIENGITLCDVCHRQFHSVYSNRISSPEAFMDFYFNLRYTKQFLKR